MFNAFKKNTPLILASMVGLLASCSSSGCNVLSTTFIHKYGTTLTESDWEARGGNGQVVLTCKDGTTIKENYVDGKLEGKTTHTFPHSKVVAKEEQYRNGHLQSETLHFTSGVPKQKREYISEDEEHLTTWFQNGNPRSFEKFVNHKLESGEYYTSSNDLESKVALGVGTKIERNTYGEFIAKVEYKDGEKCLVTTYHPNNDPKVITPFKNGQVHGVKKYFSINGIPERFEHWENGLQQGKTITYRDGLPYSEAEYVAGHKNGLEYVKNDSGDIVQELTWKNNMKHGLQKHYVSDSVRLEWYYKGRKVSHSDFEQLVVN